MRVVHLAHDSARAELLRGLLESAGIPAVVVGAELSAAVGGIPFGSAYPRVMVAETDAARAVEVILASGMMETPLNCTHCGYNLTGLPLARCPECGEPFSRREAGSAWACAMCGESIDGQFTACWKCGAERPGPHEADSDPNRAS